MTRLPYLNFTQYTAKRPLASGENRPRSGFCMPSENDIATGGKKYYNRYMKLDFLIDGNNFDMAGEASSTVKRMLTKLGVAPPLIKRKPSPCTRRRSMRLSMVEAEDAHVDISDEKLEMVVEDSETESRIWILPCRKAGPRPANRCVEWDSVRAWDCLTSRKTAIFFLSKRRKEKGRKSP